MARWVLFFVMGVSLVGAWLVPSGAEAQPRRRAPAVVQRAPERVCVPGAQVGCACPNGGTGVQACAADGMSLEACRCLPAPSAYIAPAETQAQVERVERPRAPPTVRVWYGWQTLLCDVAAAGVVIGGAAADSPPVILVGGLVSLFGAPLVHLGRGNYSASGLSFLLRGLNVGLAGYGARNVTDDGDLRTILVLSGIAHAAIVIADAWWLPMERVPAPPPRAALRITGGGALVLRDGGALTLSGSF